MVVDCGMEWIRGIGQIAHVVSNFHILHQDISKQRPEVTARLKRKLLALYKIIMENKTLADLRRGSGKSKQ